MEAFLRSSGIPHSTPKSSDFDSFAASWSGPHKSSQPSIITLPQKSEDVATIVKQCVATKSEVVVRGGGHDMFGRFTVAGAVSIDMRNLNSVVVAEDKKTARIGGGATALKVLEVLQEHGLQAPTGSCGTIGYTGWCLVGGLGPYMHSYGLGADQIVGARVVNAKGELVDADERLLKGLRGGGSSLAVVAELVVKTYPLQDVQAGMLFFESSDISKAVTTFFTNFEKLTAEHKMPSQCYAMPSVYPVPGLGLIMACAIVWNGKANDELRAWVDRIAKLAPLSPMVADPQASISTTSALGFSAMVTSMLAKEVNGRGQSASISNYSPEVVAALAKICTKIPLTGSCGFNVHTIRDNSPSCGPDVPDAVCPYRYAHIGVELLGIGSDEASGKEAAAWASEARDELMGLPDAKKETYLPLTAPEFLNLKHVYGDNFEELMKIKSEYDPDNVFKNTIPRLV